MMLKAIKGEITRLAMEFPCSFPLKVIGLNTEAFSAAVLTILERHFRPAEISYSRRLSGGGKYLSITAIFTAESKEQLEALYEELNSQPLVLMTL